MSAGYYSEDQCNLDDFKSLVTQQVNADDLPNANLIDKSIPIYDLADNGIDLTTPAVRSTLMAEWASVLQRGAGVFVIKNAVTDLDCIDEATTAFDAIIQQEKDANGGGADHFATAGSNDRIWNSLQKLCLAAPDTHLRYFASPAIDAACEAWLGPSYQMTAQVNVVHPGGQAQQAHRDYHLGFQTADICSQYPAHVHDLSPLMTLQGGIAHCDMSIESGPTKLLPFSQQYRPGYAAWRRDDFRAYFEDHYVQLPLNKGDAIFFNPALFHAAGTNNSKDVHRMVNLLQISSAFGRAMETIDRIGMCKAIYKPLCDAWRSNTLTQAQLHSVIASTAEGYSFPTNLDQDPPVGGLAPKTQQALLLESVKASVAQGKFDQLLQEQLQRREA